MSKHITPECITKANKITQLICDTYSVSLAELRQHTRQDRATWPRLVAMALCERNTHLGQVYIANIFRRTHACVINARESVRSEIETNPRFAREFAQLEARLM